MSHLRRPFFLGLTGSIGAGKSTVSRLLRERGFAVLDADQVAREVSDFPDTLNELREAFGEEIIRNGRLDRARLGSLIFQDPAARVRLNAIIHPRVRREMKRLQEELVAQGTPIVVQDIPLLFENGLDTLFDATLLVDAPFLLRARRVMARDNTDLQAVAARDRAQMPSEEKRGRATITLDNDGDLSHLERQLDAALLKLGLVLKIQRDD